MARPDYPARVSDRTGGMNAFALATDEDGQGPLWLKDVRSRFLVKEIANGLRTRAAGNNLA
jgi:hypothetical protein